MNNFTFFVPFVSLPTPFHFSLSVTKADFPKICHSLKTLEMNVGLLVVVSG